MSWWSKRVELAMYDPEYQTELVMRDIVNDLIEARLRLGMSQADVAQIIGVTRAALNHWENLRNQPAPLNFASWAFVLGYELKISLVPRDL